MSFPGFLKSKAAMFSSIVPRNRKQDWGVYWRNGVHSYHMDLKKSTISLKKNVIKRNSYFVNWPAIIRAIAYCLS